MPVGLQIRRLFLLRQLLGELLRLLRLLRLLQIQTTIALAELPLLIRRLRRLRRLLHRHAARIKSVLLFVLQFGQVELLVL